MSSAMSFAMMKRRHNGILVRLSMTARPWKPVCLASAILLLVGCGGEHKPDPAAEAPPPAKVEAAADANVVSVDNPEQFPLSVAVARKASSQLVVTGVVAPDISRTVPVISIATGRVVDIKARLGDTVRIVETRPLSKLKRWRLKQVVTRSTRVR